MKYIEVEVDTNDADYVSAINEISDEDLVLIMPLIEAIRDFKKYHNYPYGDCCREDLGEKTTYQIYVDSGLCEQIALETFENGYIPYPPNGFHTIESIRVFEVTSVQVLISNE